MKIKITVFLLISFVAMSPSYAQSIHDSIIKNVTLIDKEDVVQDNGDYLIDVVLQYSLNEIPVILNDSRQLPTELFLNRLFKSKPVLLITPNWQFYDTVAEEATRMEGCIEPAPSFIYYQRLKNNLKTDSIKVADNYPKLVFNSSIKELKTNDHIVFYHTESLGSSCCPRDPKWDEKEKLNNFISSFETKNNVKIGAVYKKITGKEGEQILYFTLSNLNLKQKLDFLQEVRSNYLKRKKTKQSKPTTQIYMPSTIRKEDLIVTVEY